MKDNNVNKDYELIERIGKNLYSENHWKTQLEIALKVKPGCVNRWRSASEKFPDFKIKPGIWRDLIKLLEKHQKDSEKLIDDVNKVLTCKRGS